MVATRPGSEMLSSGSDLSRAAPAACSMVPMAPSQTSNRSPDSSCAGAMVPAGAAAPFRSLTPGPPSLLWLRFRQRVEDLERHLGDQPVSVIVQPQPGDLLDPFDTVSHRIRVDVQQPGGTLWAVVLPEVTGEGRQVLRLVLVFVLGEPTQHFRGEGP